MKVKLFVLIILCGVLMPNLGFSQERRWDSVKDTSLLFNVQGEEVMVKVTDTNPNHFPIINFSQGLGFSGTPHMLINSTTYLNGFINFSKYGSLNVNYTFLMPFWRDYYHDEFVEGDNNSAEKYSFKSMDVSASFHLYKNYKSERVGVFYRQDASYYSTELTYLKVPSCTMHYLDLSVGYFHYKDILSNDSKGANEELSVYSNNGVNLKDVFLNYSCNVYQAGLIYGRQGYIRARTVGRNLQDISTDRFYFYVLYSPGVSVEDVIYTDDNAYSVDLKESGLSENKFGFKLGYSKNEVLFSGWAGYSWGVEVGMFPGIKGFSSDMYNLYGRVYVGYSLNFLKKNGAKTVL